MTIRHGSWFFGKCSNCRSKEMVRKLKSAQVCVRCAEKIIENHGGAESERGFFDALRAKFRQPTSGDAQRTS